jgi:hypothetical protein
MFVEQTTITPEKAAELLANNPTNRPIRGNHVAKIARDMKSGDWQVNGDAIRLNGSGELIDGQHRLSACIRSGVPFETLVITGLPVSVRSTIDDGATRKHGDRLAMNGHKYGSILSAASKMLIFIANGTGLVQVSTSEMDRALEKNPGLEASIAKVGASKAFGSKGTIAAFHYITSEIYGENLADEWLDVWCSGIPAYDGDPVHLLRERLMRLRMSHHTINRVELFKLWTRCIEAFVIRQPLSKLIGKRIGFDEWTPERCGVVLPK